MRGLYAIIDPAACKDPLAVAEAVLRGGCAALQLRAKHIGDADYLTLGHALVRACRTARVPFFVNDRVALVRELGADGVHVGQTDAPIEAVRAVLGPDVLVGVSTHSLAQARAAEQRGASMIGFGPVFTTHSKLDPEPVVGLEGLRAVCAMVRIPVIAIGGIGAGNAAQVASTGAPLAAVISAVCSAPDPEATARTLHRLLGALDSERGPVPP
jgi:thiamine-phosphate pyrophosphorylase